MDDAYDVLADAFDVYDEALGNTYGEALPVVLADDEDDEDDDEDDGQDEEDDDDAEERLGGIDEGDLDGSDYDEDVDALR